MRAEEIRLPVLWEKRKDNIENYKKRKQKKKVEVVWLIKDTN